MNFQRSIKRGMIYSVVLFIFTHATALGATQDPFNAGWRSVCELLRNRIERAGPRPIIRVGNETVYAAAALPRFYEERGFMPAWCTEKGFLPVSRELMTAIRGAEYEGLKKEDYHLKYIEILVQDLLEEKTRTQSLDPKKIVDVELLLTDAFMLYGSHLLSGRVNPETIDSEWYANRRGADFVLALNEALSKKDIRRALENLLPPQKGYSRLRDALALYRNIQEEGGWSVITPGPLLQKGDVDQRANAVRERLMVTGDLSRTRSTDSVSFDASLERAVLHFQRRHGLETDGKVGPGTLAAMNVPVEARIEQIIVNLERWRWLQQELGEKHILVNIANFSLDVYEGNKVVLSSKVIVGKPFRRTPVFSDLLTYLVFNPYWHVPKNIAMNDILPLAAADSTYLPSRKIRVFQGENSRAQEINPLDIDWKSIHTENFPYIFRQDPGPNNALGRVKFMFPNRFSVYLHDSPVRELYNKTERTFSSGCIRVEKAVELAEYVLSDDKVWDRRKIAEVMREGIETTVPMPGPMPVHLLYWTAWVDDGGQVHFRKDIYERDTLLARALFEDPPVN